MSTRKRFLAAAASTALIGAAPPSPGPPASPAPSPKPPAVSEAARAFAKTMSKFDPNLTDRDFEKIAQGIDANLKLGTAIDRGGKSLKNWNEPAAAFEAAE